MKKKSKKICKAVSTVLYWTGMLIIFAGMWFLKDNFLLGINMMPIGLVVMFVGWVLDAYEIGYTDK